MENNDEHMYKNPRWIATRAGVVCLIIATWIIADDAYRDHSHKEYLQCVLQEASDYKAVGSTNIYEDPELSKIRDNCGRSMGREYEADNQFLFIDRSMSPTWKRILLFPSYLLGF
jgi:hypothetical protein